MEQELNLSSGSRKLTLDTFADGSMLYLRFSGAIDEDFDGKKLADQIKARMVVLQLAEIQRISSFGIREWIDFINALSQKAEDIILVECAPRIVDQINMVANFTGAARVFSFYAPYRCDYCDEEHKVILQLDRDWDVIKSMRPPDLPCTTCGELQHFDEDPVTYLSYVANQGPIELPQEVRALLTSPAQYRPSVLELSRRLHVDKLVEGAFTHIRLSGDLDGSFPRDKLSEGLEGVVIVDLTSMGRLVPAGAAEWRRFMQMITPAVKGFYITGMPQAFLEKLGSIADLGAKAQILDLWLNYGCSRCGAAGLYRIDVEQHYEHLRHGKAPELQCRDCKGPASSTVPDRVLQELRGLPRPELSKETRAFRNRVKDRKSDRLATEAGVTYRKRRSAKGLWLAVIASLAIAGGAIGFALVKRGGKEVVAGSSLGKLVQASADSRPAWITSDTELSGECQTEESMAISCTGVSSSSPDREEAERQAREAALEGAVRAVGLLIDDTDWAVEIGGVYGRVRQAKVAEFANEQLREPGSMRYQRAKEALIAGRRAVVDALAENGGEHVGIDKPADLYWERYLPLGSEKEQYVVFVRYAISEESTQALLALYGKPQEAIGGRFATAFPGLAWLYPGLRGGAVLIAVDAGFLKDAGMVTGNIITAIQGRPVKDVNAFIQVLGYQLRSVQESGGDLRLTVEKGGERPSELSLPANEFTDE